MLFHLTFGSLLLLQFSLGIDGKKIESESNVLLASIENMQYAVTLDVLQMVSWVSSLSLFLVHIHYVQFLKKIVSCNQVFSSFGPVLKIAMFDKNGGVQALIQYPGKCLYTFLNGIFLIH